MTKALEPILAPARAEPDARGHPGLKVCDPAMGSGAFLVEAMRQLAKLLVEAWNRHGNPPRIPADETPVLFASRLIAQRCLYGVDKNRMAVDLAKLSLWLATLAKDHAFSFLDHNFRHGDSLVGLSLAQIEACHWAPDVQQAFVSASLRHRVAVAMKKRQEILTADEFTSYEKLSDLRVEADKPLDFLRFLGDAVLGVFFEGGTASARERRRADLSHHDPGLPERHDRHADPARPAARHRTAGLRLARDGAGAASRSTGRSNSPRSSWRRWRTDRSSAGRTGDLTRSSATRRSWVAERIRMADGTCQGISIG